MAGLSPIADPVPVPLTPAERQLVEAHVALVYYVIRRHFGALPAERQDDAVGDGCLGLVMAAKRYDPSRGTTFRCFATPRVWGSIAGALRAKLPTAPIDQDLDAADPFAEELPDGYEDLRAAVEKAIGRLDADQGAAVRLRVIEGLTCREISRRLGRGEDWTRRRVEKGIAGLRELLRDLVA